MSDDKLRKTHMIPRFHCPSNLAAGGVVALPPELEHHAQRVLRLRPGASVVLFDGKGGEWNGHLVEAGRELKVALDKWQDIERESPLRLTLAQALPAADKMDWVIQKAVELGVTTLQPLAAKRSVVRLSGDRVATRLRRWQQVATSACEQCGRNRVPEVSAVLELPNYLALLREQQGRALGGGQETAQSAGELRLMLSPHGGTRLSELVRPQGMVTLLVGPEGGFEPQEAEAACLAGFTALVLGPRVLRTETAGMAAIAAMMALWGDF